MNLTILSAWFGKKNKWTTSSWKCIKLTSDFLYDNFKEKILQNKNKSNHIATHTNNNKHSYTNAHTNIRTHIRAYIYTDTNKYIHAFIKDGD